MEERRVTISRAKVTIDYPASFMLIASMNPCPCGFYNHPEKNCVCGTVAVKRYLSRISGPLLDRIDLHVEVVPVKLEQLTATQSNAERSTDIAARVVRAREIQMRRFKEYNGLYANAQMPSRLVREVCALDTEGVEMLKTAMTRLQLSARAYDRILKVARTIADLAESEKVESSHLAEAIQFRSLDRANWAG
jgi:magnesium chelatase family protein